LTQISWALAPSGFSKLHAVSAGRDASGIQPGVRDETGGVVSGGGKSIGNVSEKDVHVSTLQTVDLTENRISAVDILYIVYINFHFRQCCR